MRAVISSQHQRPLIALQAIPSSWCAVIMVAQAVKLGEHLGCGVATQEPPLSLALWAPPLRAPSRTGTAQGDFYGPGYSTTPSASLNMRCHGFVTALLDDLGMSDICLEPAARLVTTS